MIYIAPKSQRRIRRSGALEMGAREQGRLTESSGSLNDVYMKGVFETAECEAVRNSILWELINEKHENQMKGCTTELKVSDWLADERVRA